MPRLEKILRNTIKTMFNVIITVPEEWTDYDRLKSTCDYLLSNKALCEKINIVLTNQNSLAARYANEKGYGTMFIPVDWKLGKKARVVRDYQLADLSNACIAFFSSYSANYQQHSMVDICMKKQILVRKVNEDIEE